jgi:hypothetical protein
MLLTNAVYRTLPCTLQKRIEQRVRATLELPDEVQWEMRT